MSSRVHAVRAGVSVAAVLLTATPTAAQTKIEYNRDIRPILAENCFACHGPDSAARKGDLRIDGREAALKSGAVVPGKPQESKLVARIRATDSDELMPPPKTHKTLTDAQKKLLEQWIAAGAEYQAHWSFIAPKRPAQPAVKKSGWARNAVDLFVLAKLEKAGMTPAPEADRRTLARRLALDLTGLPPEPQAVEAFVADRSPNAYEKYVDSLMQSSAWGEHRARYWLDYARYADTHGIHFDNFREMWSYRDWTIQAFNANQPYDKFSIEQLAGDLLPNPTLDQKVATGFNRCNITTNEGGAIDEEYLVLYARDRTETTSAVFLGLTAGCAVCHDHKYDPLTAKEFYALSAFFNNTTQRAMDGNIHDTPPAIRVPRDEDRDAMEKNRQTLAAHRTKMETVRGAKKSEFAKWLDTLKPSTVYASIPHKELQFQALLADGGGTIAGLANGQLRPLSVAKKPAWQAGHLAAQAYVQQEGQRVTVDDVGDFDQKQPFTASAWIWMPRPGMSGAVLARMAGPDKAFRGWDIYMVDGRIGSHFIHQWPDNALKVMTGGRLDPKRWYHVAITYDGSGKAAGLKVFIDGVERADRGIEADSLRATTRTEVPFRIAGREATDEIRNLRVQDARLYTAALDPAQILSLARASRAAWIAANPALRAVEANRQEVMAWWLESIDPAWRGLQMELAKLQTEEATLVGRSTIAHVMAERPNPAMAYLLHRGEYDKRRDEVKPETPKALPPMPADLPRNRLGFAQWLFRPEHPLTARVAVNRMWQELFGTGLVKTSGDFGVSGELPSDQELLDWLAVEFRESGWDMKRMYKMLVMSAAYRQAATVDKTKLEKDPDNRLLSRGPRFRMDAEMVRDYALAASGLLNRRIGGPSVKPYQPDGVWEAVAMPESNTRNYRRDSGANLYRRSMYTLWKRSAPPAAMDVLNAPSRETCTVRRERTNTPLQALLTLNDVQFVEAARRLAERTLAEGGATAESRAQWMAAQVLARPLAAEELAVVTDGLNELAASFKAKPEEAKKLVAFGESKTLSERDAAELAAWTMIGNQLLNLDETLNK